MPPSPSIKAILICDQIIQEHVTGKKSLIGIFENIHIAKFPVSWPRIAVYINLTGAHGKYAMEIRLIDAENKQIGTVKPPEVEIDSPLRTCEFALHVNNVRFAKAGQYAFQILANDELLATKIFNVQQSQVRAPGQTPPSAG